jgi:hypothetical protein
LRLWVRERPPGSDLAASRTAARGRSAENKASRSGTSSFDIRNSDGRKPSDIEELQEDGLRPEHLNLADLGKGEEILSTSRGQRPRAIWKSDPVRIDPERRMSLAEPDEVVGKRDAEEDDQSGD